MDGDVRTRVAVGDGPRTLSIRACKLVALTGGDRGREFVLETDLVRVGKAEENDIVLNDETVSRAHAELALDDKGWLLRDLKSTNGTFLDGAEIQSAYVRAGAVIKFGAIEMKFQPIDQRIEILPSDKEALGEMVGRSAKMREIYGLVERIAPTDATVLLGGETGTGKDMVARTLHALSRRRGGPFVVVDCGAVSGTLIESELFGHEKGSFTGAVAQRQGAFEMASGGTIFLDELGELSLDLQPKLLRVLETREFRRVGGSKTIRSDVRVIAATKHDLPSEVERGKFREDLFFRLSVVPITMPSLRVRREDIPLLVRQFLHQLGGPDAKIDDEAIAALSAHDWPGNVRELRNVIERSLALGADPRRVIMPLGLEGAVTHGDVVPSGDEFDPAVPFRDQKERWSDVFEKKYLGWLLARSDGNISRAARDADMDRKYLHKLLRKHGLVATGE